MSEAAVHLNHIHCMLCMRDFSVGLSLTSCRPWLVHMQCGTYSSLRRHTRGGPHSGLCNACSKDFHRSAKNSWLPVFNSASLEISSKEMNVGADRLAAILGRAAQEGRELNIWRQFGHMTMDVVGSAAFGLARSAFLSKTAPLTALPAFHTCTCKYRTQDALVVRAVL